MRTLYPTLLEGDALHRVYALESAALELTYIARSGPDARDRRDGRHRRGADRAPPRSSRSGRSCSRRRARAAAWRAAPADAAAPRGGRAALARPADDRASPSALPARRSAPSRSRSPPPARPRAPRAPPACCSRSGGSARCSADLRLLAPARRPTRRAGSRCCSPRWGSGTSRLSRCPRRPRWRRCCSSPAPRRAVARDRLQARRPRRTPQRPDRGVRLAHDRRRDRPRRRLGARGRARRRRRPGRGFATAAAAGLVACAVTAARRASLATAGTVPSVA